MKTRLEDGRNGRNAVATTWWTPWSSSQRRRRCFTAFIFACFCDDLLTHRSLDDRPTPAITNTRHRVTHAPPPKLIPLRALLQQLRPRRPREYIRVTVGFGARAPSTACWITDRPIGNTCNVLATRKWHCPVLAIYSTQLFYSFLPVFSL